MARSQSSVYVLTRTRYITIDTEFTICDGFPQRLHATGEFDLATVPDQG